LPSGISGCRGVYSRYRISRSGDVMWTMGQRQSRQGKRRIRIIPALSPRQRTAHKSIPSPGLTQTKSAHCGLAWSEPLANEHVTVTSSRLRGSFKVSVRLLPSLPKRVRQVRNWSCAGAKLLTVSSIVMRCLLFRASGLQWGWFIGGRLVQSFPERRSHVISLNRSRMIGLGSWTG
jgi:hypothetical protein